MASKIKVMDSNTKDVLLAVIEIISAIVTALMIVYVARSNKKIDSVNTKVDVVEKKLDENHTQQNGNLNKLLETTKQLATAQEKARNEAQDKSKK